jgi:DNA-binding LytR/AlgR family response regulator
VNSTVTYVPETALNSWMYLALTHFYANDKLTYAATAKKDFTVDYTIAELEQPLDPAKFDRIHRSTIVNLEYVQELHSWFPIGCRCA